MRHSIIKSTEFSCGNSSSSVFLQEMNKDFTHVHSKGSNSNSCVAESFKIVASNQFDFLLSLEDEDLISNSTVDVVLNKSFSVDRKDFGSLKVDCGLCKRIAINLNNQILDAHVEKCISYEFLNKANVQCKNDDLCEVEQTTKVKLLKERNDNIVFHCSDAQNASDMNASFDSDTGNDRSVIMEGALMVYNRIDKSRISIEEIVDNNDKNDSLSCDTFSSVHRDAENVIKSVNISKTNTVGTEML